MTIDKIKAAIKPEIFNYWTALKNGSLPYSLKLEHLNNAKKRLSEEIRQGIRDTAQDRAELKLLELYTY
jgi:hypothetical protein